jgi:hypothetical protein
MYNCWHGLLLAPSCSFRYSYPTLPLDGHPEMVELGMKPRQQECRMSSLVFFWKLIIILVYVGVVVLLLS